MGDFNCHHTLWGCEEVNNRDLFNDKSHTIFSFCNWYLYLGSPSIFRDFSWKLVPTLVVVITFQLFWRIMDHLQKMEVNRGKLGWIPASVHQSDMNDADDTMSFYTSILKDIAEKIIPKTSAITIRFNKPWFSETCKDAIKERNRALERFKRQPTEGNLNAHRIARTKAHRDIWQ